MRLTNTIRDAFVRAALQDVPHIDYREQIRKLLVEDSLAQLPSKIRALAKDKSTEHFLRTEPYWKLHISTTVYNPRGASWEPSPEVREKCKELLQLEKQQQELRDALETKLRGVANSVTTRKALVEALPQFEKYLPAEEEKTSNLPALTNLVADFKKAGWPKTKSEAAAEATA